MSYCSSNCPQSDSKQFTTEFGSRKANTAILWMLCANVDSLILDLMPKTLKQEILLVNCVLIAISFLPAIFDECLDVDESNSQKERQRNFFLRELIDAHSKFIITDASDQVGAILTISSNKREYVPASFLHSSA